MVMTDGWIIGFWYVWFLILKIVCFAQISYSLLDKNVGVFYSRLALIFRCVLRVLFPLFFYNTTFVCEWNYVERQDVTCMSVYDYP